MGAGIVKQDGNAFHINISNSAHPRRQTTGTHRRTAEQNKCEECSSLFTPLLRKVWCKECDRNFCDVCLVQPDQQCKKCIILLSGNFTRQLLQSWKVKDLKALLDRQNVNTSKCREKNDLIDLIFSYFGHTSNLYRPGTAHERHVEELVNRMRLENLHQPPGSGDQTERIDTTSAPSQERQEESINHIPSSSSLSGNMSSTDSAGLSLAASQSDESLDSQQDNPHLKLEDIKSEEEIDGLSIRSLKRVLLNNFVDFKGCCERWELQARLKRLWKDNEQNKKKVEEVRKSLEDTSLAQSSSADDNICHICMDAAIDCVLLECGHMVSCTKCGKQLSECPICRQFVIRAVHIFKV